MFWKNRKPFNDYWQQDVEYSIKVKIDEGKLTVGGTLQLFYTNNSSDTLQEVFFHLYQNAFQEGAYYDKLQKNKGVKPRYGLYEKDGLGTVVNSLTSSKGVDSIIRDNTLLNVKLKKPILPYETVAFTIEFKTYWGNGSSRRRMKAYYTEGGNVHFNGVHWYPRMAVYDRKFGWNTNQHLDKEFYGDFGTFDVELDFANDYIVEATGILINEADVLPLDLKNKLHISNFYHRGEKGNGDTLTIPIKREKNKRKVWKYHAENVHDFAFTADPTYRLDERTWNGKKTVAIVEERHCPKWKTAAQFAMDVIKCYSEDFGMYEYPKMVVADAQDGMEYPMLTLDAGVEPFFKGLFAHEIAHNWFYGMLGSNETYRAFMDEGFTQFLTVWSLEKLDGEIYSPYDRPRNKWYVDKYRESPKSKDLRAYLGYLTMAIKREDPPLNTHSSDFDGGSLRHGGGYGQVYSKTAVMLYNLQYVLGDSLFQNAMRSYVKRWKFAHPYPEDFREAIISYSKVDLNWFFDQWLETTKSIDYSVKKVKKLKADTFEITFLRKGSMQMPIDFSVTGYNDTVYHYHVPNTWFIKSTPAKVLPKWYGWGNINPLYKAKVVIPSGVNDVKIDASERLADINPLNNSLRFPITVEYDAQLRTYSDREKYRVKIKPDFWWNSYDGLKVGANIKGSFFKLKHVVDAKVWMNTSLRQGKYGEDISIGEYDDFSYDLRYSDLLSKYSEKLFLKARFALTGGVHKFQFGLYKTSHNVKHQFGGFAKSLFKSNKNQINYALYPEAWQNNKLNNTLNFYYRKFYKVFKGKGNLNFNYRSSAFFSDYSYDFVSIENKYNRKINRFYIKTRWFGGFGYGDSWAAESMLYLAGANPESLNENKFTQAEGLFTKSHTQFGENTNVFHSGGGLNLRGFAGYFSPEIINGEVMATYKGTSGTSVNIELEFDGYLGLNTIKYLRKWSTFRTYVFADAGIINILDLGPFDFAEPRVDAGLGFTVTVKKFYQLETVKPVAFRMDFPIFLNKTPNVSPDNFRYRWIIGINRAF
jgi:aminopeptidase N